jgi:SAM-dependent methyltransferase
MSGQLARTAVNQAERKSEGWQPPPFTVPATAAGRAIAIVRRLFDLQAASIWRDLAAELPAAQGSVLDVGCGAQPYRCLLGPGVKYVAIDTADAEAHFGYSMPDTIYYRGDEWPVAPESADVVLCTETLEHVLQPHEMLMQAFRALRPGGTLLLTVPFSARWHYVPYDYWRFTPSGLKHLLEGAGFGEVFIRARGNRLTVACAKNMALLLPWLLPGPEASAGARALQAFSLLGLPWMAAFALAGNLSLRAEGGEDCLGYTALARKPASGKGG